MSYDSCYIFDPITENRKSIFDLLIRKVPVCERILDLGAGPIGYYWALGYAHAVSSIDFFDSNKTFLQEGAQAVNALNPAKLQESFATTIEYLKTSKILQDSNTDPSVIVENLITKIQPPTVYNFFQPPQKKEYFDVVLTIESIECVSNINELTTVLKNIHTMLKPGGSLLQYSLQYTTKDPSVVSSIRHGTEGTLNPSHSLLTQTLSDVGYTVSYEKCVTNTHMQNYGAASYIQATK